MNSTIQVNRSYRSDLLIAAALFCSVLLLLLLELDAPGVTWDEALVNFAAAKNQAQWLSGLFTLERPFSRETIDQYWFTTSDHPSLPRTLAAISYLLLSPIFDEIIALRIPSAVLFSILIASIYLFLRRQFPVLSALAGALALLLMPRIFGHAHIFSLDVPIMCWWFWSAVVGYLALQGKVHPVLFGLTYAITFTTKLHAVFLPFPFTAWVLFHFIRVAQNKRATLIQAVKMLAWAAALTLILYIALQPWLWHDTWTRIIERFFDYAEKSGARPIPLFYLGTIYHGNEPWHYPFVMLLFTLPLPILVFHLLGWFSPFFTKHTMSIVEEDLEHKQLHSLYIFSLLHFLTPLLLILLPLAQAYDGVRLFLPAFPFAALLAGMGFHWAYTLLLKKVHYRLALVLLYVFLTLPSLLAFLHVRPFYLSYYNELAGGVRGAAEIGMESTYWCDALTKPFLDTINELVPDGSTMRPLSMPFELIEYYKQRGWLKESINHTSEPPYDFHLLQSRQGMFTQAEMYFYYRKKPLAVVELDGVPLFALYGRM